MATPKRKTSKSKRNMRRSHDSLKLINVVEDKESGEIIGRCSRFAPEIDGLVRLKNNSLSKNI